MNGDILKHSKYGMPAVALALVIALVLVVNGFLGILQDSIFPLITAVNNLTVALNSKIAQVEISNIGSPVAIVIPEDEDFLKEVFAKESVIFQPDFQSEFQPPLASLVDATTTTSTLKGDK